MFKKLFGKRQSPLRNLTDVSQLIEGDIISLKHRRELPDELEGQTLEVVKIGTYQYEHELVTEFSLKSESNKVYQLAMIDEDGEQSLCFSIKLKRTEVLSVFSEDEIAELWNPDCFPEVVVQDTGVFGDWLAEGYQQSTKEAQAFYYSRDCRNQAPSNNEGEDNGEELRYHECEGNDDRFGLCVEVWGDGSTDVWLQKYTDIDVIEQFFPHGK